MPEVFKWPQTSNAPPAYSTQFYCNKAHEGRASTGNLSRNLSEDLSFNINLAEALTGVIFNPLIYFEINQAIPQETAEVNLYQPSPSDSAI